MDAFLRPCLELVGRCLELVGRLVIVCRGDLGGCAQVNKQNGRRRDSGPFLGVRESSMCIGLHCSRWGQVLEWYLPSNPDRSCLTIGFFSGMRSSSIYRIALIWLWPLFLLVSTLLSPRSVIFDFRGIFRAGGIIAAVQLSELEECFNTNPSQKHCSWTVKLI